VSTNESQPVSYQPGQVVNGHVWTGTAWLPVQQPQAQGNSTWRLVGGLMALFVAAVSGYLGLSWMLAFVQLGNEGNQFAGLLAILGLGALAVAAGFAITGMVLLTKKR
jgi:hypothetical protein